VDPEAHLRVAAALTSVAGSAFEAYASAATNLSRSRPGRGVTYASVIMTSEAMRDRSRARVLLSIIATAATTWAVANCFYVYLALHGARSFRVESATILMICLCLPRLFLNPDAALDGRMSQTLERLGYLVPLAIWLAIVVPLIGFPFLSDDYVFLDRYRHFADARYPFQFFRPLFAVIFVVLNKLGHGSPVLFHALAFGLHAATAWLASSLTRRVISYEAAPIVFAVFLTNPLQLEAVLWVSGLQEVLWAFFTFAALRVYIGQHVLSTPRVVATLLLATCALLSKETAVCIVGLIPLMDWSVFRFQRGRQMWPVYAAFCALLTTYLGVRSQVALIDRGLLPQASTYVVKQFLVIPYRFFSQPWNSTAVHVPPVVTCLTAVAILVFLWAALLRGMPRRVLIGPAIVLLATAPLLSYFFVREDLLAARYVYVPMFGWAVVVASVLTALATTPRMIVASSITVACLFGVTLIANLRPWRTAGQLVSMVSADLCHLDDSRFAKMQSDPHWTFRGDVPQEYEGVGVFINGYPEFVRLYCDH
jgi:hypothetical protein